MEWAEQERKGIYSPVKLHISTVETRKSAHTKRWRAVVIEAEASQ